MKRIFNVGLPSIAVASFIFLSAPAFSTGDSIAAAGFPQESIATATAQLEPNYQTSFLAESFPGDFKYVTSDAIAELSPGGAKSAKAKSSVANKATSGVAAATLSAPPVYGININTTYTDTLTTASPESQYLFTIATATKFAAVVNQQLTTNSNIDIKLYRKNPTTLVYNQVSGSYYGGSSNEQLSEVATPGTYLLAAYAVGPITGGGISIRIQTSTGADSNEPDDNIWQAQLRPSLGGVAGNLDYANDKDFHKLTLATATSINYSLTDGNNYEAKLYYANGQLAYTLPSNVIATLPLPAGTYYWGINSPTGAGIVSSPYTFSAFRDIASITLNYNSDEGTARRDWGAGNYLALSNSSTVTGYAYDASGSPVAGAYLRFTNEGSISGLKTTVIVKTNAQGFYNATIASPSGFGAHSFMGACLKYYYDVHTLTIERYYGGTSGLSIGSVTLIEGQSQSVITNSKLLLNDIAYNIYMGCN